MRFSRRNAPNPEVLTRHVLATRPKQVRVVLRHKDRIFEKILPVSPRKDPNSNPVRIALINEAMKAAVQQNSALSDQHWTLRSYEILD